MKLFKVAAAKVVEFVKFVVAAIAVVFEKVFDVTADKSEVEIEVGATSAKVKSADHVGACGIILTAVGAVTVGLGGCKEVKIAGGVAAIAGSVMSIYSMSQNRSSHKKQTEFAKNEADESRKHELRMADKDIEKAKVDADLEKARMDHEYRMKHGK